MHGELPLFFLFSVRGKRYVVCLCENCWSALWRQWPRHAGNPRELREVGAGAVLEVRYSRVSELRFDASVVLYPVAMIVLRLLMLRSRIR